MSFSVMRDQLLGQPRPIRVGPSHANDDTDPVKSYPSR
jgi:hypothetical protein